MCTYTNGTAGRGKTSACRSSSGMNSSARLSSSDQRCTIWPSAIWSAAKVTWSAADAATAWPAAGSSARAPMASAPATNVWRHQPDIDLAVAAIFDPFGNAVHTALTFPVLGEDVLITVAGPIGIMAAIVARHAGARYVVITDVSPYRLDLARKVGVTVAADVSQTSLAQIMADLGMREGFDVGMEMSGKPKALREMLGAMTHGGKVAMLGLPSEQFAIDWAHLVLNMITIKGIYGREMFETWYEMSVLTKSGVDISPVITHRFDAADYAAAFDTVRAGKCGKVVLDWAER